MSPCGVHGMIHGSYFFTAWRFILPWSFENLPGVGVWNGVIPRRWILMPSVPLKP